VRKLGSAIRHFFEREKPEEFEAPSPVDAIVRLLRADAAKDGSTLEVGARDGGAGFAQGTNSKPEVRIRIRQNRPVRAPIP
jgi:hypothetical protein